MAKKKQKYYVVWKGVTPGVYHSWADCQLQIRGFPGAVYKSFSSLAMAQDAYGRSYNDFIGSGSPKARKKDTQMSILTNDDIIKHSFCVDAACSGNPGAMEYRGVRTATSEEIFRIGPLAMGTNNIGEFLALVHILALSRKNGWEDIPVYSDSRIAIGWVKKKKSKSLLKKTAKNQVIFDLTSRAELWLANNNVTQKIIKWETKIWGEIPADFGRK